MISASLCVYIRLFVLVQCQFAQNFIDSLSRCHTGSELRATLKRWTHRIPIVPLIRLHTSHKPTKFCVSVRLPYVLVFTSSTTTLSPPCPLNKNRHKTQHVTHKARSERRTCDKLSRKRKRPINSTGSARPASITL